MQINGSSALAITTPKRFKKRITKQDTKSNTEIFKMLYGNLKEDCYVRILSKENGEYKAYNIKSMLEQNKVHNILNSYPSENLMVTFNTYKTMHLATQNNLFSIQAIVLDVDFKFTKEWKEHTPEQILGILQHEYFGHEVPTPTLVEYGNNLRLIYVLEEPLYVGVKKGSTKELRDKSRATKVLVNRIGKVLGEQLQDFNASAQQIHTYMRPAGTTNTRNQSKIEIVQIGEKIFFEELQEWLPDLPTWYEKWKKDKQLRSMRKTKKKKGTGKKVINLHNVNVLNQSRLNDLVAIQKYLNSEKSVKGYRHQLSFLYFNCRLMQIKMFEGSDYELTKEDYRVAADDMLEYNSNFINPLNEKELEGLYRTQARYKKLYRFTNEKMIDLSDININILKSLGITFAQDKKTKKESNKDYYMKNKENIRADKLNYYHENKEIINKKRGTDKQTQLLESCKKIDALMSEGHPRKEIIKLLDISIATYKNRLNQIKKYQEQGLL